MTGLVLLIRGRPAKEKKITATPFLKYKGKRIKDKGGSLSTVFVNNVVVSFKG